MSDPIEVRVQCLQPRALRGVVSRLPVLLEIETGATETAKRPPLEVAIVLDKSGSMSGSKLDSCKEAIVKIIESLTSQDRLHLVTYDTDITTVFSNVVLDQLHKPSLIERVNSIHAGSNTNISGGLSRAAELLRATSDKPEEQTRPAAAAASASKPSISASVISSRYVQRIFLFSDGLANEGLTDDKALFALVERIHGNGGLTVSTFGIGNDFRESTMRGIAEHGHGYYTYMQLPNLIPTYVSKALDNLLGVIGIESTLKLRGLNGSVVSKVRGHDDLVRGAQLHDLRAENKRQIVAEVEVRPLEAPKGDVMAWELSYLTPSTKETRKLNGVLTLEFTDSDAQNPKNAAVEVAVCIQDVSAFDNKVLEFLRENRVQEAILQKELAIQMLQDVQDRDTSGFVSIMLSKAQVHLAKLRERTTNREQLSKEIGFDSHLGRRASICAMHEMSVALTLEPVATATTTTTTITTTTATTDSRPVRKLS